MRIKVINEGFSVCKVEDYSRIDMTSPYCFIGNTPDERSLVCRTCDVPEGTIGRDDGWSALMIDGVLDFSLIGILSGIAAALASAGIGIFAISTFNTDYILVKDREGAIAALTAAGNDLVAESY